MAFPGTAFLSRGHPTACLGASTRAALTLLLRRCHRLQSFLHFCGLIFIIACGHCRDIGRKLGDVFNASRRRRATPGYAPLMSDFDSFYTRRFYKRIEDSFNRPICSAPDAWMDVMERRRAVGKDGATPCYVVRLRLRLARGSCGWGMPWGRDEAARTGGMNRYKRGPAVEIPEHRTYLWPQPTGTAKRCLNLASYNYLGFANQDPYCTPRVLESLSQYGPSLCSAMLEAGHR